MTFLEITITASWTPVLNRLRPYTDDTGDRAIDVIISILQSLDDAIDSNKIFTALFITITSVVYTQKILLPHINDIKIRNGYSAKMDGMTLLMEEMLESGDMKDLLQYIISSGQGFEF